MGGWGARSPTHAGRVAAVSSQHGSGLHRPHAPLPLGSGTHAIGCRLTTGTTPRTPLQRTCVPRYLRDPADGNLGQHLAGRIIDIAESPPAPHTGGGGHVPLPRSRDRPHVSVCQWERWKSSGACASRSSALLDARNARVGDGAISDKPSGSHTSPGTPHRGKVETFVSVRPGTLSWPPHRG